VRSVLEASIADAWRDVYPDRRAKVGPTQRLNELLGAKEGEEGACPGLTAYMSVAASDNGVGREPVLRAARELYLSLSALAHGTALYSAEGVPADIFSGWGQETLVAYAAIVSFSGRRISFNSALKETLVPLKLRSLREMKATAEERFVKK
jgi:hypothetical protein